MFNIFKNKKYFVLAVFFILLYLVLVLLDLSLNFIPWGDVKLYESIARKIQTGSIPYIDYFFEYPPGSILVYIIPAVFTSTTEAYRRVYEFLSLGAVVLTLVIAHKTFSEHLKVKNKLVILLNIFSLAVLLPLGLERFDTITMLLVAIAVYLFFKKQEKYRVLCYMLLTLGGLIKLYPFLLIPILAIYDVKASNWKILLKSFFASLLVTSPFLLLILYNTNGLKFFLDYHTSRGLQLESTFSSLLLLLNNLGITKDLKIIYDFATYGVDSSLSNLLAKLSTFIFLFAYVGIIIRLWVLKSLKKPLVVVAAVLSVMSFILFNKVFSTQYFLWLIPITYFSIEIVFSKKSKNLLSSLLFISAVLTILIYPLGWEYLNKGDLLMSVILFARNVILLLIFVKLFIKYLNLKSI